jgi:hypothetical protein
VAELAVCLPVVLTIVLGTIGTCSFLFTRQAMCTGAYEAARVAVRQGGTAAEAVRRCEEVLAARGIRDAEISFSAADVADVKSGEFVTVTVNATSAAAGYMPRGFYWNSSITVQVAMVKE